MKLNLNLARIFVVLTAVLFLYASCKKSAVKPPATVNAAVDTKALSSQIAVDFYNSITGKHGGTDIGKGVNSPLSNTTSSHNGLMINSVSPLCGYVIDTTYNYSTGNNAVIDTVKAYFGNFNFTYTCDASQVNGYIVKDSLVNTELFHLYEENIYVVSQKYTVKALDQTYKLVSMDGSLYASTDHRNNEAPRYNTTTSSYNLNGLRVNFASGTADVTAGKATFKTTHTIFGPETNDRYIVTELSGTIEFLGNYKAKLTIVNGSAIYVYNVDLRTGVVTPA